MDYMPGWLAVAAVAALTRGASALDNGLATTPPLGWRSFNAVSLPARCRRRPPTVMKTRPNFQCVSGCRQFWGIIDQVKMETTMDALVGRSRMVGGRPTSLLELGYRHVGLDGGWNYCYPNNKTFHQADGTPVWCDWAKGRPCQGNVSFPSPQDMVAKAKRLGLSPGWCELMPSHRAAASRSCS